MHVSHPEIPCVLWKRLYCSSKSNLGHGLGFDIKSGLPCYLEFCTISYSSRLYSHHDSLIPHHLPFLCMHVCMHASVCICVFHGILSQGVFSFLFFFFEEQRSGLV